MCTMALNVCFMDLQHRIRLKDWWKELLERMERFFKIQLSTLVEDGDYDASDDR